MGSSRERAERPRARGDDGTALVEFALVMVLLFMLIFGIINFGLILSFKQDVTRAAAEGARAGAVALPVGSQTPAQAAEAAALSATKEAVAEFGGSFGTDNPDEAGKGCQRDGMSCGPPIVAACPSDPGSLCVTVEVTYDYGEEPLYGDLPIISGFLPDTISATSVARIND